MKGRFVLDRFGTEDRVRGVLVADEGKRGGGVLLRGFDAEGGPGRGGADWLWRKALLGLEGGGEEVGEVGGEVNGEGKCWKSAGLEISHTRRVS